MDSTFDDLFDSLFISPEQQTEEPCCDDPYITESDGYLTCIHCGQMGRQVFRSDPALSFHAKKALYKRLNYFRELMYLFNNIKLSNSPKYPALVERLKGHQIVVSINKLIEGQPYEVKRWMLLEVDIVGTIRKLLRMDNSAKFYKHVYNIILDLFDFRVFNVSRKKIEEMCMQFFVLENKFKELYPQKPNMLSYKILISNLFRRNGVANYPFVLKPINHLDVQCLLSPIWHPTMHASIESSEETCDS